MEQFRRFLIFDSNTALTATSTAGKPNAMNLDMMLISASYPDVLLNTSIRNSNGLLDSLYEIIVFVWSNAGNLLRIVIAESIIAMLSAFMFCRFAII
jgi:hypothetical protein